MSSRMLHTIQARFSRRRKSYDPAHDPDLPSNYHQWSQAAQEIWCAIMTDLTRQDAAAIRQIQPGSVPRLANYTTRSSRT